MADSTGAAGNMQWFALCTYHAGGLKFYGTTSSETSVYKKDRTTVQLLTNAAIPINPVAAVAVEVDGVMTGGWTGWEK